MNIHTPFRSDASSNATTNHAYDGQWLRALPDWRLLDVWRVLLQDNIVHDNRLQVVMAEMGSRGIAPR